MPFLSRLRSRQEKPPGDAEAEEVRHLGPDDQERLRAIAFGSGSLAVRRSACRKLTDPEALIQLGGDADPALRDEALRALFEIACGSGPSAGAAAGAVKDTRHLITLARAAALEEVRLGALERLDSPHALAILAKTAPIAAIRAGALARVRDPQLLLAIALKGEHKDTAVGAMEGLEDLELVRRIAQSETSKAARRARARLEPPPEKTEAPAEPPSPEPVPDLHAEEVHAEAPPEPPAVLPEEPPAAAPPDGDPLPPPSESAPAAQGPPPAETRRKRLEVLEALCVRVDAEAKRPDLTLRQAETLLREAKAEGTLPDLPPRLVRRLRAARGALFARAQELREAEDWGRWASGALQEELCRRIEGLVTREDYDKVAVELRQTDEAWQRARQAPPGQADVLRKRYQDAHALVKARIEADLAKRRAEEGANRAAKEALCQEAEALSSSTDWLKTTEAFKALQTRWKAVGPMPRHQSERLWARFRAACDTFFKKRDEDRDRRKEEWGKNLTQKEALCAQAEALQDSTDWDTAAAQVRKLQAAWKAVGPVRRSQSEKIWQRFRTACDAFFERYKHRDQLKLKELLDTREGLLGSLEALVGQDPAPGDLAKEVQALLAKAEQAPLPDRAQEERLQRRFVEIRDRLIEAHPESFKGSDLDPEVNRAKREKLCARVEALAEEAAALGQEAQPASAQELARRLKEALAARTIGGAEGSSSKRKALQDEASSAKQSWSRIGPVPGETGKALATRFEQALARFQRGLTPSPGGR
jgi:hypothetical protein